MTKLGAGAHSIVARTDSERRVSAGLTDGRGKTRINLIVARQQPYTRTFAPQARQHLRATETKYQGLVRDKIREQLTHQPDTETTNRKRLRLPLFGADWELRFGPQNRFRVFYTVDPEQRVVQIVAIGVKERNRVIIAGEEFES
jgi:hypothetical protein